MKDALENTSTLFSSPGIRRWLIAGLFVCLPGMAGAEVAYVTHTEVILAGVYADKAAASVHADQARNDPLEVLPVDSAVEIISRDEGLAQVRTASGTIGWIDSSYLMAEKPVRILLLELEAEQEETKARLEEAESRLRKSTAGTPGGDAIFDNDLVFDPGHWFGLDIPPLSMTRKWAMVILGFLLGFALGGYFVKKVACRRYYLVERTGRRGSSRHRRDEARKGKPRKDRNDNPKEKDGKGGGDIPKPNEKDPTARLDR
uniref:SH3 domain protein n=1 Tax=Candidatus Kentrum sp. LFY TaxID=2126342 RepID=A0A450WHC8_9GAMM|nr:MAG: hypothetical protein BECKLFY1418C_GA0070996_102332 [Candidatus Kentron sp. LFY]